MGRSRVLLLYLVFLVSGFAALIYQVVWQRALLAIYGVNIESVTIVVAAFMLGLGLGSLAGGALSRDARRPLLVLFASIETALGLFGFVSLELFHFVGRATAATSGLTTFLSTFVLVLVPTVLMGATLPILVAHSVRRIRSVGQSVGMLYFVNTLGSALAGFTTAAYLLGILGQQRTVAVAASLNLLVGASVFLASRRPGADS